MPSTCGVSTSTSLDVTERKRKNGFSDDYHGTTFVQREEDALPGSHNNIKKRPRTSEVRGNSSRPQSVTSWSTENEVGQGEVAVAQLQGNACTKHNSEDIEDDTVSCISTHDWADSGIVAQADANKDKGSRSGEDEKDGKELVGTPELWDALSSLFEDDCPSDLSGLDTLDRFDQSHDADEVDWSRMDKLMVTHEYGAWTQRMKEY